jgi:DNA-binding transcriptional ArsR family regulator
MAYYDIQLDSTFHALADRTRRAVVQRLCRGPATVSELAKPCEMAFPSFMKHVGILEKTGLISSKKNGRTRTCTLEHKGLAAAEVWFGKQRAVWEGRYENLDILLSNLNREADEN